MMVMRARVMNTANLPQTHGLTDVESVLTVFQAFRKHHALYGKLACGASRHASLLVMRLEDFVD
jgi:hypothetical protein